MQPDKRSMSLKGFLKEGTWLRVFEIAVVFLFLASASIVIPSSVVNASASRAAPST